MIELRSVTVTFNEGEPSVVHALREVNLRIAPAQFVVVVGSNGSGKSTLLNAIAGSILPTAGDVFIEGRHVSKLEDFRRSRWVARIFQDPLKGTAPDMSILDNFRLAALRPERKSLHSGVTEKFKSSVGDAISQLGLGLEHKLDRRMGSLSGGQRQALTLLMALFNKPAILLMDEPAASLDPRTAEHLMSLAARLVMEYRLTTVLVTHRLKDARHYGNRLLLMSEGRVARDLQGVKKESLAQQELYGWFE